jgi:hypothetical protein
MATFRKHVIPEDSFAPDKPLNDLMYVQFEHFKAVARTLPPDVRAELPPEPTIDPVAAAKYVAAVTERLHLLGPPQRRLVSSEKRARRLAAHPIAELAATAEPGVVPPNSGAGGKKKDGAGKTRGKKP